MKCEYCNEKRKSLKKCSLCRDTHYCSLNCQKSDWILHKHICKKNEKLKISIDSKVDIQFSSSVLLCGGLLSLTEEYLIVRDIITEKMRFQFKQYIYQAAVGLVKLSKKKFNFSKIEKFLTRNLNYRGILFLAVKYNDIHTQYIKNSFNKSRKYKYYLTISDDINCISKKFKLKNLKNLKKCGIFFDKSNLKFEDEKLDYQNIIKHKKFDYYKDLENCNFTFTDDFEPEKNNKILWNNIKDGIICLSIIYDFLEDEDNDILSNILWILIIKYVRNGKGNITFYDIEKKIRKEIKNSIVYLIAEKTIDQVKQDTFGKLFLSNYEVRFFIGQKMYDEYTYMHEYSLKNIKKLKLCGLPVLL